MSERPVPDRVSRAAAVAAAHGFSESSRPEVGRLLQVLAAASASSVAEVGTGLGYGAAWLLDGLPADGRLVTVERDADRVALARDVLDDERASVVHGDLSVLEPHGPFDLLFVDAPVKYGGADTVLHLVRTGGILVLDDFTPSPAWPPLHEGAVDELRLAWLTDERLVCQEVQVAVDHSVLLTVRKPPRLSTL
jgi:predicted O-methyltransferase YrrM